MGGAPTPLPKSALRNGGRRSLSAERAYAPARPSPLAQGSTPSQSIGRRASMRSPSPSMYSRSPTPNGQGQGVGPGYTGSGGALLNVKPNMRGGRRNSAPSAVASEVIQQTQAQYQGQGPSPSQAQMAARTGSTPLTVHISSPSQTSLTLAVASSTPMPPSPPPASTFPRSARRTSTSTKQFPSSVIPPAPQVPPPSPPATAITHGLSVPPSAMRQSGDRSSVSMLTSTAPSAYSQEGTASDIEPVRPPVQLDMMGRPGGR
ncbi:hypothetical protein M422DRAFT_252269 [Sphaerobolus stellatus SS14]|uniref:Uncharacterized protein n=1 Tax=Sphaerobolus stellatus (strain SS14) TaxID=990650 RepID=A0A0C9VBA8_SPHS4|nr:hypothetical protein M422DRAFT_252269 [Sphaerobolus stellatus SS14]